MQTTGASDAEAPERHIGGPQQHVRAFSRFGRAIFRALFMRDMAGGSYRPWLARTFEPELLSMNLLMAGMAPTIKILATRIQSAGAAIALLPRQPRRGAATRPLAKSGRYRTALQRPSKLFAGSAGLAATTSGAGGGAGAACCDGACGNAAGGGACCAGASWDGACAMSPCGFGLSGGEGVAAGFGAAAEDAAAGCGEAAFAFAVAGVAAGAAAAGAAAAAAWLPPRPNHLPMVCRVEVDCAGCAAPVVDAGV